MKQLSGLIYFLLIVSISVAQNVGINDASPSAKLTVKGSETTADGQAAAIKLQNTAPGATNAWYLRAGATGNNTPADGFSIADNGGYRFNITNTGNIGIGTVTPLEKLTLLSGNISLLSSNKGVLLNGFDGPMINRAFDQFTTGNYTGLGRWGLFMEPNNLTIGIPATAFKAFAISSYNNNSTINKQLFRVSVDAAASNALVEVNGAMKIEGSNTLEFGAGIAGKEINAGKIGYNSFSFDGLSIVGSGTTALNRKVYVFAEGGTTFNGPINVGGSTGTTGQVLTSNGLAAPSWQNAAYTNNTRFAVLFNTQVTGEDFMDIESTTYNLNSANITVGENTITINKTGLYRFSGSLTGAVTYTATLPPYVPHIGCNVQLSGTVPDNISITSFEYYVKNSTGNPIYYLSKPFSSDMHVLAGTVIRVSKRFFYASVPGLLGGQASVSFRGHLIAE